ncbi:hypothetical protein B0A53_05771 [Rhodotorula sp. CCFEE 5036]|nr:hypothetical protein B0A53_05771 [Rhodotorula sp. CCFEE 5036]
MLTLDTLPLPVLLEIIKYFPVAYIAGEDTIVHWPSGPAELCKANAPETIALAGCNRALRRLLLPVMFHDCHFGKANPTEKYAKRLDELSRGSGELLACIRNLTVMAFTSNGIKAANACIGQMTNLETIGWYASHPVPPLFVQTLCKIPSFKSLVLREFGVESLPHILPLADQLTKISINSERQAPAPKSARELAPVLVGASRRSRLPWDERNVATVEEQREALLRDLPPFLARACKHVEELAISGRGLCDKGEPYQWLEKLFDAMVDDNRQYPNFPRLERLWLRHCNSKTLALKHLLSTTGVHLRTLEVTAQDTAELPPPPSALRSLKELCYFMLDHVRCVDFVNAVTQHSPLDILYLNGIRHIDILPVFGSSFRCGETLRQLRIQTGADGSFFTLPRVRTIVASCPNLVALEIKGNWGLEAVDLLQEMEPLKQLRRFAFDHPWERPRSSLYVEADGRTIRSERNGDFRIISVMGTSIAEEMGKRIQWDIDAARPRYRERFGAFAKRMPVLERIRWSCTEAVDWTWTFERRVGQAGQPTIVCHDDADIPYGKTIVGPKLEGGGIYLLR